MSELSVSAQAENTHEIQKASIESALDSMGNHPAKMIALLIMSRTPGEPFTGSRLFNAMLRAQGSTPGWKLNQSIPLKYCRDSLEPIGMLIEGSQKSKKGTLISNYRISETGREIGVPLAGTLLDWELEYPDLSLQEILGATNSTTRDRRNPSTRVKLFSELLASPEALPPSRLTERIEDTQDRMQQVFHRLADTGVIDVAENSFENREVTIDTPDMEALGRANRSVRPEIVALYGVAKALSAGGEYRTNAQEVVEKALELNPSLNGNLVWSSLVTAVSAGRMKFYNIYHFSGNHNDKTLISVNPKYEDALRNLVFRLDNLSERDFLTIARSRAHEIINDPELVALLMNKARINSSAANAKELDEWRALVVENVPEDGIDSRGLYERVSSATARKISYVAFRTLLNNMDSNDLEIDELPVRGKFGNPISFIKPV